MRTILTVLPGMYFFHSDVVEYLSKILIFGLNLYFGRECKYLHFVKNCRSTFRRQCNNAERSVP